MQQHRQQVSYRGGARLQVAAGTIVRAAVGRAFRAPTISDRFLPPTSFFGVTFVGNPELAPEVLVSAELGVTQRVGARLQVGLTGFATRARDFWDFVPEPEGVFRVQNIAEVEIRGLEMQLLANVAPGLDAAASYTFTDATYGHFERRPEVVGNRLDDNVQHQTSLLIGYRTPIGHTLHAAARAVGPRFTDLENTPAGRLPAYFVADAGIAINVVEKVAVTLDVTNLTDERYKTRPEFSQPGRAVRAGVRLGF